MKKCILMLLTLSLLVCTAAHAMEPPVIDLSGFAAELDRKGYPVPKTLDEAIGDASFGSIPKYELIVDELNDQYILKLDAEGEVSAKLVGYQADDKKFKKSDAQGVYAAKGIGDYDELWIDIISDDSVYYQKDSYQIKLSSNRCIYQSIYFYDFSASLAIKKVLDNVIFPFLSFTGFYYIVEDYQSNYTVNIYFDLSTDEPTTYSMSVDTSNGPVTVEYEGGNLDRIHYHDQYSDQSYIYSVHNGYWSAYDESNTWTPDNPPCTGPFEVTPDMYPYPDFLP